MPFADSLTNLSSVIDQAKALGLIIRLSDPQDLTVISGQAEAKEQLASIVRLATGMGLRVKWLNEGTLVAIGVPTKKPQHNGKEVRQENPQGSEPVLRGSRPEGRQDHRTN